MGDLRQRAPLRELTAADKQKWARGFNRVMAGVTGVDVSLFRTFELTTKLGDDNTWDRMAKDFRKLIVALGRKGYSFEYVASPELSPKNGLLHLHGVMRGDKDVPHKLISELWERYHGAKIVYIQRKRNAEFMELMAKYAVKHMMKDYPEAIGFKGRLLMSKGWLPEHNNEVRAVLIAYARNWWLAGRIADRWDLANLLYRRWLHGERIVLGKGVNGKFLVLNRCVRKGVN